MKKLAIWSPPRGVWEDSNGVIDLFSEHSEPFSATWPSSGMTRNGVAYVLPTPALPTPDTGYLFLPTPEAKLSDSGPDYARANRAGSGGDDLTTTVFKTLLPTPVVTDSEGTRNATANRSNPTSKHHGGYTLTDVLLPTPTVQDGANTGGPSQFMRNSLPLNTLVMTLLEGD